MISSKYVLPTSVSFLFGRWVKSNNMILVTDALDVLYLFSKQGSLLFPFLVVQLEKSNQLEARMFVKIAKAEICGMRILSKI